MEIFNCQNFENTCTKVAEKFEKTAPTVSAWVERIYMAKDTEITLADIHLLAQLEEMQPNYAANRVYKLMNLLGQDTTGHLGF